MVIQSFRPGKNWSFETLTEIRGLALFFLVPERQQSQVTLIELTNFAAVSLHDGKMSNCPVQLKQVKIS